MRLVMREIEEVLYAHSGILECAVIGVPDEVRGEEVLAVVAPKPGAELDGALGPRGFGRVG
jgi:long-chain acyl-CoA synthetase